MKFLDEAKVYVASGAGGNGCVSFLRLKFIEFGLLAVSLLIIFGLVATSPRNQPPAAEIAEAGEPEISPMQKL